MVSKCKKINECAKVDTILDKDMLEHQYADAIRHCCAICKDKEVKK
jgi:hypothetical protein